MAYYGLACATGDDTWTAWSAAGTNTGTACYNNYYQTKTLGTGTGTLSDTVWYLWNGTNGQSLAQQAPQPIFQQQQTVRNAQQQRELQERLSLAAQLRAQELVEATERAVALLKANLDDQQLKDYEKTRSFTVISGKNRQRYRIDHGYSRNIRLLDKDGHTVQRLCAHVSDTSMPTEDHMLAQKLFLEHAEEDFLRVANVSAA